MVIHNRKREIFSTVGGIYTSDCGQRVPFGFRNSISIVNFFSVLYQHGHVPVTFSKIYLSKFIYNSFNKYIWFFIFLRCFPFFFFPSLTHGGPYSRIWVVRIQPVTMYSGRLPVGTGLITSTFTRSFPFLQDKFGGFQIKNVVINNHKRQTFSTVVYNSSHKYIKFFIFCQACRSLISSIG